MFGFGKKKRQKEEEIRARQSREPEQEGKQKSRVDKLVMGAIIGVAVGSVIGMAVAPQKGKDTRKLIVEKSKDALEKGKEMSQKFMDQHKKQATSPKNRGLMGKIMKSLLSGGRKRKSVHNEEEDLRKIPNEVDGNFL